MTRVITALLVLVLARPETLVGQAAHTEAAVSPRARVRVTLRGAEPREGVVIASRIDTLVVQWPEFTNGDAVPLAEISRLEVSTGRPVRKRVVLGALVGSAAGTILGAATYKPCTSICILGPDSRATSAAVGAAAGGVLGLAVGFVAGLAGEDGWKGVALDDRRVAVSATPRADGTRLRVTLQF